ncbi:hypothetical protein AB2M62_02465 [Sphingomonas sp. MMS12-HWE2-04]|uniref:hypothetical protein n=1 Tax=Sphingomonas sp. MMS12-HWE2-04 TaxID=3234199 RepID=UPI003850F077
MRLPPLAIGAGAGLLAAALLAPAAGTALDRLAGERASRAQLAAERSAPPAAPLVAPDLAIRAPDEAGARAAILARVQRLAKTGGVLVEETAPVRRAPLAALRLRISGPEKSVIALADALERERPLMRLHSWRLEPIAGGVRLTGEVIAPWQ